MKNRILMRWVFLVFAFALCALQGVSQAGAKDVSRKSVVDYFYLLPDSYFEVPQSKAQRKAVLFHDRKIYPYDFAVESIADVKNDYARISLDAVGTLEVAVYRYKGRDLIAVRRYYEGCTVRFLTYKNGRWKDVTKQVMPVRLDRKYDYILPRYGTITEVRRDLWPSEKRGRKVYDLLWQKGRFQVRH